MNRYKYLKHQREKGEWTNIEVPCPDCKGFTRNGTLAHPFVDKCYTCKGTEKVIEQQYIILEL